MCYIGRSHHNLYYVMLYDNTLGYVNISEVNSSAFIYRLFHEAFMTIEEKSSWNSVNECSKIKF